ncbi:MFS transporter [Thalassomonas haliotis]|uniref:MFS transporter n=1 Tax=Thalassomonas haliotis TaxID=485448 RepID=A0ABY7VEP1_9GAMM|nr:MFS transporter [Thalassomonas haliotis]WDE11842.1 MFS transporter [Thalassomonas haliotis]
MKGLHFYRFAAGTFSFFIAGQFLLFVIPLFIYLGNKDIGELGKLLIIEWTPALIAFPLAGYWVDKFSAQFMFYLSNGVRCLACIVAYFLVIYFPEHLFLILSVLAGVAAFFLASARVSAETIISENSSKDNLAKLQTMMQSAEIGSMLIGPALAAIAVTFIAKESILLCAAFAFFLPLIVVRDIKSPREKKASKSPLKEIVMGFSELYGNKLLFALVLLNCTVNLLASIVIGLNAAVVTSVLNKPEEYYGYLNMSGGVVALLSLAFVPYLLKRIDILGLGIIGLVIAFITASLLTFASEFYLYLLLYVVMLSAISIYNVYNRTTRVEIIPKENFGSVMGAFYVINISSVPLSGVIIYLFSTSVEFKYLLAMTAGFTSVISFFLMTFIYKEQNKRKSAVSGQEHDAYQLKAE